jgi:hypothetical protein
MPSKSSRRVPDRPSAAAACPPTRPNARRLRPDPDVVTDPDFLADIEQRDGRKWKRLRQRDRGKSVNPPDLRHG